MKPAFNSELVIQLCGTHSNIQLFVTPWSGHQKQLQIEPSLDVRISKATVQKDSEAITLGNFHGYSKYIRECLQLGDQVTE